MDDLVIRIPQPEDESAGEENDAEVVVNVVKAWYQFNFGVVLGFTYL